MFGLDLLAIGLCGVSHLLIGGLWYGVLFSGPWMSSLRAHQDHLNRLEQCRWCLLVLLVTCGLVMGTLLAWVLTILGVASCRGGALCGLLVWAGVAIPLGVHDVFFERKTMGYLLMSSGFHGVSLISMGILLTLLQN